MEKEEFDKLKVGDIVYLFKLDISSHYHVNKGIAVELKKIEEGSNIFEVTKVISGKILKVGDHVEISERWKFGSYYMSTLFQNVKDGIEWWNIKIRNAEDGLTSQYEKRKKSLIKRLIKDG